MNSHITEETRKALEILREKKSEKKEKEEEKKAEEKEIKQEEEQEKAAVWLTGGLEDEIHSSRGAITPSLQINPVSSLEDVSTEIPTTKKEGEEKKTARPYETEAKTIYETSGGREEIYEETPENLFSRLVRPMEAFELRQQTPRVQMPVPSELREIEGRDIIKYVERKPESSELSFLRHEKREEFRKYKKIT